MKMLRKCKSFLSRYPIQVFIMLLLIPILVTYDNNPAVLKVRTETDVQIRSEIPLVEQGEVLDSLSRRYAEEWGGWWRMDERLARRIIRAADRQQVPHHIAFGLVAIESGFDSMAVSHAGAVGLAQVRVPTARIYDSTASVESLKNVDRNLDIGLRYFHDLLHDFDGDVYLALAAYNMGPTRVRDKQRKGENVSMSYPNKVMGK